MNSTLSMFRLDVDYLKTLALEHREAYAVAAAMAPRHPAQRPLGSDMHRIRLQRTEASCHAAKTGKREPDLGMHREWTGFLCLGRIDLHLIRDPAGRIEHRRDRQVGNLAGAQSTAN